MSEWVYHFAACSAMFFGGVVLLGAALYIAAMCIDGMWRWWGFGQQFLAFTFWRLGVKHVRLQQYDNGEWKTVERLPSRKRTFFKRKATV